jgi:chromosome segregation protein
LLKLKRVEIQGFKSFYDRTELKFSGSGIAAVVGPNGCGKSNLSDAISWVLGEQSAKSLRGARMEDVIFAGTRDKKALGMASVTMTLVPDEAALAAPNLAAPAREEEERPVSTSQDESAAANKVDHDTTEGQHSRYKAEVVRTAERTGEITITRRLYRSGESEYLINGRTARLRDIQDLFLGTGLGPESYAIIEQGRIGQILSNRPQDRRAVIEESAGITKFKTRKRLAEAKLESAKQNLARVFDILEEVTRQANSLKRQAAKTKRYGELKTEGTTYLREVLSAKFRVLERETAKLTIELNLTSNELAAAHAAIAESEGQQTSKLEQLYGTELDLTAARKKLADLQLEAERVRGRLESQVRQIEQIENRLKSSEVEAGSLEKEQGERTQELQSQMTALESLGAECTEAKTQLDAKSAERQAAQTRLAEQEKGLEAARQRVLRLLGESSGLKNRITQTETHLASADRDTERARAEEQQATADGERVARLRSELSERLAARQTELVSVTDQRKEVESELQGKRSALGETRHAVDRLRGEHSRVKARKDSLEEVIQHRSYTTETVKKLFTAVEKGKAADLSPVGVLADFLEVDPQIEKATEEFLHEELEFVVVRNWDDAQRGIELIRSELDGRATFLVESSQGSVGDAQNLPQPAIDERISKLTDALRLTNGLTGLAISMLPRIANCYVVNDRQHAPELAGQYPHCWFLTQDGLTFHGRAVSGGKKTGAGPLALKRELREVSKLESAKQAEVVATQRQLAELERSIQGLVEQLEELRSKQQAQEKDVLALDHENRKLAEESQRVQGRLSRARLDLERLSQDRSAREDGLARDRAALEVSERNRFEEERALESAQGDWKALQSEVARAAEEHATLRANLASIEERRRSLAANKGRLETQVRDLGTRREHLLREMERLVSERANLTASNAELESKRAEIGAATIETDGRVKSLAEQEGTMRQELSALEEELKRLRLIAHAQQEKRSELQVALARAESDLKHLEETAEKELQARLAVIAAESETIPGDQELADLEAKYNEVRRKIEALGPVNPQALEEYEDAQQRQEFLQAQRQDLLDSIRDTEKAIGEIDTESRKRFGEAFHAINANFREMFKNLFGGGIGEMRLTDEENLAESGIDIVASPPGKRLQSVLLLSGGEKSLTAMALLMSIFQYTPSPFCILDEVDAPLDEPNIERLTKLLRNMAEQTQFIVITHSKRTMEAAQALYGVTMQEPGVSRLVSVKFDTVQTELKPRAASAVKEEELEPVLA